jgi:GNAT superfamily N-acetyltransferase
MKDAQVSLQRSEPIFPVNDVVATVRYYRATLGFTEEWLWGDPPDFGGVRWGKIGVMFALKSGGDAKIGGQWHAFIVDGLDDLHEFQKCNGATIFSPPESKPWGLREYTVRDLNGHYLRFGEGFSDRSATVGRAPASTVAIVERMPTLEEYEALVRAVGWGRGAASDRAAKALAGTRSGVVAVESESVVGAGLILGDGASCAYLKDIMVRPEWQGRGVGSRIVQALLAAIRRTMTGEVLVTLFTGRRLGEFYERFGFRGPEDGLYGMSLNIDCKDG